MGVLNEKKCKPLEYRIAKYSGREAGGVRGLTREDLSSSVNIEGIHGLATEKLNGQYYCRVPHQ